MAKNLKLNIKNAQLAEALKLAKPKKAAAPKVVKEKEEPVEVKAEPVAAPVQEPPKFQEPLVVKESEKFIDEPPVAPPTRAAEVEPQEPPRQPPVRANIESRPASSSSAQSGQYQRPNTSYQRPNSSHQGQGSSYQRSNYSSGGQGSSYQRPNNYQGQGSSYQRPNSSGPGQGSSYQRPNSSGQGSSYQRPNTSGPNQGSSYPRSNYSGQSQGSSYPRSNTSGSGEGSSYQRPNSSYPYKKPGGSFTPGQRPPFSRPPYSPRPQGSSPGGARPPFQRRDGAPGSGAPGARPYQRFDNRRPPFPPREPPRVSSEPRKAVRTKEDDAKAVKKGPGFREYRDVKPLKKSDERTFDSRDRQGLRDTDDETWRKRRPSHKLRSMQQEEAIVRPKNLKIRLPVTVKDLAAAMKLKASEVLAKLFLKGMVLTLNDYLDDETTVQLLGHEFDCEIVIDTSEEERVRITDKTIKQEIQETDPNLLVLRPPVVTFMGHVDHGKTSLIDAIRKSDVASTEAGAITQHIGAFQCHTAVGKITILDTPGHEAFSSMRARGADVTDIVVLVVAGDEGMRAQTLEAIQQAREAHVPIMVAINKCDKQNFNVETVYRQLSENELLPEAWGGTTITVNCSAVTNQGIPELLEMLALQAEVLELRANPLGRARGTVIESQMHKGLGAVATVLVQNGTLHLGDSIVFDQNYARVKTMHDEHGKELKEAGPSAPVKITGLSGFPEAGSEFIYVRDEKEARELSEKRTEGHKHLAMQQGKRAGFEGLLEKKVADTGKKFLNLILKADVQGSLEALKTSLLKIESKKAEINVIATGVGEVSESDIELAAASKATIIGFHTDIESRAESLGKEKKVTIRLHDVIYHAVDDVRLLMTALLDKVAQENNLGTAEVKAVFKSSHLGNIAGSQVTDGLIRRNCHARLMRDGKMVWKGPVSSLKRNKEDVREVQKGLECGILLQNFNDVKVGDIIEAYEVTYLEQEL